MNIKSPKDHRVRVNLVLDERVVVAAKRVAAMRGESLSYIVREGMLHVVREKADEIRTNRAALETVNAASEVAG
jgi:hypothetical protein